jgi:carbon monoxide dehydrogenase subunit G
MVGIVVYQKDSALHAGRGVARDRRSKKLQGQSFCSAGPVALSFVGTARFEEIDNENHRARVRGQGLDTKGRGGANGVVTFVLSPIEGGTKVDVNTELNLSGFAAQYGRGVGMIQDVATQIVGQFATALRAALEHDKATNGAREAETGRKEDLERQVVVPLSPPSAKPISGFSLILRVLWSRLRRLMGSVT